MSDNFGTVDFSQAAIKKEIVRSTLQHPSVLYPGAVGVLGVAAALLLGPGAWVLTAALAGSGFAGLAWGLNFVLRREHFANTYIKQLFQQLEQTRLARTQQLEKSLREAGEQAGVQQFALLKNKFAAFRRMLEQKLSPSELTYSRYLGMAEQVYLACLDNLYRVVTMKKSTQVIDESYINARLVVLKEVNQTDAEQIREIETLQKRLALKIAQQRKIRQYFTQNEEAMTQLDMTTAAIADMRTEDDHANMDIETSMKELAMLAKRAKDYSKSA